jgi:hypothetical protein
MTDRIVDVLSKKPVCVWPTRRAVDRLWLDDNTIPSSGLRLWIAIQLLKWRGLVVCKKEQATIFGGKTLMIGLKVSKNDTTTASEG